MLPTARILLVDDDEYDYVITRNLLAQLETSVYELEWAGSFEAGLDALQGGRYDVCLIDYRLGERTGLDLLREAVGRGLSIPMILLTGQGDPTTDAEALDLGASGYLEKGKVDAAHLDRAVRYALSRESMVSDLIDQNAELLRLHRLTEVMLGGGSLDAILRDAVREIARGTGFPIVAVERYDPRRRCLRRLALHGIPGADPREPAEQPVECALAGHVVLTQRPRIELNLPEQGGAALASVPWPWVRTYLCLPMVGDEQVVGALALARADACPVDSSEVNRAATLANHLGRLLLHIERTRGLDPTEAPAPPPRIADTALASDLEGILTWFERQAERQGRRICLEPLAASSAGLRGDRERLQRALPLLLSTALRHAGAGVIRVQTFPPTEREQLLVSFHLAAVEGSLAEWQDCLATCRALAEELDGSIETLAEPDGGLRVLLGAHLRAQPALASRP